MALVLGRKPGQKLIIGDAVVTIESIRGNRVKVLIEAPPSTKILRGELERFDRKEPVKP